MCYLPAAAAWLLEMLNAVFRLQVIVSDKGQLNYGLKPPLVGSNHCRMLLFNFTLKPSITFLLFKVIKLSSTLVANSFLQCLPYIFVQGHHIELSMDMSVMASGSDLEHSSEWLQSLLVDLSNMSHM